MVLSTGHPMNTIGREISSCFAFGFTSQGGVVIQGGSRVTGLFPNLFPSCRLLFAALTRSLWKRSFLVPTQSHVFHYYAQSLFLHRPSKPINPPSSPHLRHSCVADFLLNPIIPRTSFSTLLQTTNCVGDCKTTHHVPGNHRALPVLALS